MYTCIIALIFVVIVETSITFLFFWLKLHGIGVLLLVGPLVIILTSKVTLDKLLVHGVIIAIHLVFRVVRLYYLLELTEDFCSKKLLFTGLCRHGYPF